MNIKTTGAPRISVSYEGIETSGEGAFAVIMEIVGIILFFILIGVLR